MGQMEQIEWHPVGECSPSNHSLPPMDGEDRLVHWKDGCIEIARTGLEFRRCAWNGLIIAWAPMPRGYDPGKEQDNAD